MSFDPYFVKKNIVITGASAGIGESLAYRLSEYGARLALIDIKADKLNAVKFQCANSSNVVIFECDVCDREKMNKVAQQILKSWGEVDIVIANAGIGGLNPGDNFSLEINEKTMSVNFFGTANTVVPFIESMKSAKKGQIVGICSQAAYRGLPMAASYSASKAAQSNLLESLRVDLRSYGIFVSTIYPGFIKTSMTNHSEFKMPFMISTAESTDEILKAIKKRKSTHAFPLSMSFLSFLNRHLPNWIYDYLICFLNKTDKPKAAKTF